MLLGLEVGFANLRVCPTAPPLLRRGLLLTKQHSLIADEAETPVTPKRDMTAVARQFVAVSEAPPGPAYYSVCPTASTTAELRPNPA
jgi:hypothetical protein